MFIALVLTVNLIRVTGVLSQVPVLRIFGLNVTVQG